MESSLIIAMKGHPGTGKSTLARAISISLQVPLLDKDDDGRCDYDVGDVKRIVVDTTAGDDQEKLVDIVLDFVKTSVDVY